MGWRRGYHRPPLPPRPPLLDAPERDAAHDAGGVVDDRRVGAGLEADVLRVAAAEVEVVEVDDATEDGDGELDAAVPLPVADLPARPIADLLVVVLALPERVVRQLEMGGEASVRVE